MYFQTTILSILFLLSITTAQSNDDEYKLYKKFLSLNSTYTHSHLVSSDQVFWWSVVGTQLKIAVTGPGSDFVAVGFSPQGGMVGSVAVIGINFVTPKIAMYYLGGQDVSLVTELTPTNLVGNPALTFLDGFLILEFVWETKASNAYYNFSIDDESFMVWSYKYGDPILDYHDGRTESTTKLNYQTGAGAVTFTTRNCGTGVPDGNSFQGPCLCRGSYQPPDCMKSNLTNTHTFVDSDNTEIVTMHWEVKNGIGYFDVMGDSNGWIGIGFCSPVILTTLMDNMEPVLGWVDSNGNGKVEPFYVKSISANPLLPNNKLNLSDVSTWLIDGKMGMHFSRRLGIGYNLANGTVRMVASKQTTTRPLPFVKHNVHSKTAVDINLSNGEITIPPFIWLPRHTHGLLMYISWGILFPFGILFARYTKHVKHALWFEVHRITQTIGFLIAGCGTVVAMLMVDGSHFNTAWHAQLGAAALTAMMYQICSALLRPHVEPKQKKTPQRHLFEWSHHIFGRIAVISAWVNIFGGFQQIGLPPVFNYVHGGVIGFWLILYFIFEVRLMLNRRRNYVRISS